MKMITVIKSCIFLGLVSASFGASAYCGASRCSGDEVYVGNPNRPNTIWVPGHCNKAGVWRDGYYIKFSEPVCSRDVVWVEGAYDSCGNWVQGHYDYAHPYIPVKSCKRGCGYYGYGYTGVCNKDGGAPVCCVPHHYKNCYRYCK